MGIVNVTPDSFHDGGMLKSTEDAAIHALRLVEDGAAIVDVGGESSRPGAESVPVQEEIDRVIPVIELIRRQSDVWLSVDTSKAAVARLALEAGVDMINDITALRFDEEMIEVIARYKVPVVLMHMQGKPNTMQIQPEYTEVISDLYDFFDDRIAALENQGITKDKILIDPGLGFGKTVEHNLTLLNYLFEFAGLNRPILVGPSRKSFIGSILEVEAAQRMEGTAAAVALSVARGAHILRVHDVKEMARVCKVSDAILSSRRPELVS